MGRILGSIIYFRLLLCICTTYVTTHHEGIRRWDLGQEIYTMYGRINLHEENFMAFIIIGFFMDA